MTDETDPKTSESSAVLVHSDTEIFVSPRPRNGTSSQSVDSSERTMIPSSPSPSQAAKSGVRNSGNHLKLRLVPSRVAAQWGEPVIEQIQLDKAGNARLAVCSAETILVVKRKLALKSEGLTYVRLEHIDAVAKAKIPNKEEGDKQQEHEEYEVCLCPWNEMPHGCVSLLGRSSEKWLGWSDVLWVE